MNKKRNNIQKNHVIAAFLAMFAVLVFAFSGCFITRPLVGKIKPSSQALKKRVAVIPIDDQTGRQTDLTKEATAQFVSMLSKSHYIRIVEPSEPFPIPKDRRAPEFGIITPPNLVAKARNMRINVLITCLLTPVESSTGKKGIWPFRRLSRIYEISMIVNVMDVTTGYLYLTRLESEKVSFRRSRAAQAPRPKLGHAAQGRLTGRLRNRPHFSGHAAWRCCVFSLGAVRIWPGGMRSQPLRPAGALARPCRGGLPRPETRSAFGLHVARVRDRRATW